MDEPHVYRLYWQWRAALTVVGAVMCYGAFEIFRHTLPVHHYSSRGPLTFASLLGLGGLYAALYAWLYKVILADDAITVVSLNFDVFFKRAGQEERSTRVCLYRAEIAGVVRLPNAENPRTLAFIPKVEGGEAAYVSVRWLQADDYFQHWRGSFPYLTAEDEHARKYLKADGREYRKGDAKAALSDDDDDPSTPYWLRKD